MNRGRARRARLAYAQTGDIDLVHGMLQTRFETFLRTDLGLSEALVQEVVARGWGLAGVRQGDAIIATKIPKSGYLLAYLDEPDPALRRSYYCHCPRCGTRSGWDRRSRPPAAIAGRVTTGTSGRRSWRGRSR